MARKTTFKRAGALLVCLSIFCSLCACSQNETSSESDGTYHHQKLMRNSVIADFCVYDRTLISVCNYGTEYKLKLLDLDTGDLRLSDIDFSAESQIIGANSASIWVLAEEKYLQQYNWDGSLLLSVSLPHAAYRALLDSNGILYALGEQLTIYSSVGEELLTVNSPEEANIYPAESGVLLLNQQDYTVEWVQPNGDMSELVTLKAGQSPIYYAADQRLWIYERDAIQAYAEDKNTPIEQIDLNSSDFNIITTIAYCQSGFVLYTGRSLLYLTQNEIPAEKLDVGGRTILKLAAIHPQDALCMKVSEFNEENSQYYIDIADYATGENADYGEAIQRLYLDVATDDAPDIYSFSGSLGCDVIPKRLQSKGALADISAFLEKDPELSADMLLPGLVSALEVDSTLYQLPVSYYIACVIGTTERVGGIGDFTLDEFESWSNGLTPFGTTEPESVLAWFLAYDVERYVNYSNGTCDFDSDTFQKLLRIVKNLNTVDDGTTENTELISQGKQALEFASIGTFQMIQYYRKLFQSDNLCFAGVPSASGGSNAFQIDLSFGISSTTAYPDAAWDFVRQFISSDYQDAQTTFPVTSAEFEKRLDAPEKYETESWKTEITGIPITVDTPTDVDSKLVKCLLAQTTTVYHFDYSLFEIISEEFDPYLKGIQTLEDTTEAIQNRASIYLAEQYQ